MSVNELEITTGPDPRHIVPLVIRNTGQEVQLWGRNCWLMGYHLVEPTATAGVDAEVYDGFSTGGTLIIPAYMIAGRNQLLWMGPQGVPVRSGLFLHMIGGQLIGTVWIATERGI